MAEDRQFPPPTPELAAALLRHLDSAHNLAFWLLRDRAAAEDVVQEAVLRALGQAGAWRGGDARAWLLATVRNAAIDRLRRGRREAPFDDAMAATLPDPAPDPEAGFLAREIRAGMEAAVAALPLPLREVLVLRITEDMSYRQIAAVTGLPIGTVMSRLFRARAALLRAKEA